jgi:BirA family biotin operon repressor/biotin-[acetyl-CoA-carboxylase] ligase
MNQASLQKAFADLPLGGVRYFPSIGSTNDEALVWAAHGGPDLSVVVADEQTAGRGRSGRKWFTPAASALAFSVILRSSVARHPGPARFTPGNAEHGAADTSQHSRTVGLAALAVAESLQTRSLPALIKWPNDVLLADKKVAGILLESVWIGAQVDFTIVGIGVNVKRSAVPPSSLLNYPAISLEEVLGDSPEREALLYDILSALIEWRAKIDTDIFLRTWEKLLAFRGQEVQVWEESETPVSGELVGLEQDGSLRLRDRSGESLILHYGDVRLRPAL